MSTLTVTEALQTFHAQYPGASDTVFGQAHLPDGRTTYQLVADQVPPEARRILDVGCGDGALLALFPGREVVGLDQSAAELAAARRRLGPDAELVDGSAQALPFADGSFDAVVCHMALMLMEDVPTVVAELARVLAPGGVLALLVSGPGERTEQQSAYFSALRRHTKASELVIEWPRNDVLATAEAQLDGFHWSRQSVVTEAHVPAAQLPEFLRVSYYPHALMPDDQQRSLEQEVAGLVSGTVHWPFTLQLLVGEGVPMNRVEGEFTEFAAQHGLSPEQTERLVAMARSIGPFASDWAPELGVPGPLGLQGRYEERGLLGQGGMADVHLVYDRKLRREVALKVLRPGTLSEGGAARFRAEAQVVAQLQHPGINPIYDLGTLADGRTFQTMAIVRGHTLRAPMASVVVALEHGDPAAAAPWSVRRLVDVLRNVCLAVAYAHERGVVHRDLKPENVMVGPFGEVLVMDWGVSKVLGQIEPVGTPVATAPVAGTLAGTISGTPGYMSPEQAMGDPNLGPPSDVFSLGVMLFEVLCGSLPFPSGNLPALLHALTLGVHAPLEADWSIPEPLRMIALKAMAGAVSERYPDAGALAEALAEWLDDARRRDQALEAVARADAIAEEVAHQLERSAALRTWAAKELAARDPLAPASDKATAWRQEDAAADLERQARQDVVRYLQELGGALQQVDDLPEAHARLADHYKGEHERAEAAGDLGVEQLELRLAAHDRERRYAAYLEGIGAVSLVTDPPGAEVLLYRYEERARILEPVFLRSLGRTPLVEEPLAQGSYLLKISAAGHPEVLYPVSIGRQDHWTGRNPAGDVVPIVLPARLGPEECYVPAGWAILGDATGLGGALPRRRVWVDGYICRRFPFTNAECLDFLNRLVSEDEEAVALELVPRERGSAPSQPGSVIYKRRANGEFFLGPDADGDQWLSDWPALHIDYRSAQRIAELSPSSPSSPWRLLDEHEWEKAGRGVDGRIYPWGTHSDPTFYCMVDSHVGRKGPQSVHSFAADQSPYGVRGMAGGASDWCSVAGDASALGRSPGLRPVRGGAWTHTALEGRLPTLREQTVASRQGIISFRLARDLPSRDP